ncbi:MAG: hypothetical protein WAV73_04235 [Candidatus Moraniibacteriota bacterium]
MEKKIKQIQTAIFTRNFSINDDVRRAELLTKINEHARSIFNALPNQLPIPSNAPPEFPRFVLNSLDGKFSCNVSPVRSDVFYNIPEVDSAFENISVLLETQKNNALNIFNFLVNEAIEVARIGFIVVAEITLDEEDETANNYLKKEFIQSNKFNKPKELSFRFNRAGNSGNFEMNNLVTIDGKGGNIIIIQTDINTIAEIMDSAHLKADNFNEIISYAIDRTCDFIKDFPNI